MIRKLIRKTNILILTIKNHNAEQAMRNHYSLKTLAAYGKANTALYRAKYADSVTY